MQLPVELLLEPAGKSGVGGSAGRTVWTGVTVAEEIAAAEVTISVLAPVVVDQTRTEK